MAAKAPNRKRAARELGSEQGKNFLKALKELGPQPEVADAIEAVYNEEQNKVTYGHEDV